MLVKNVFFGAIALVLAISMAMADETSKPKSEFDGIAETTPPKKIDWEKRVKFGSNGNVTVYVDKNGIPTEIYVVGVAPVSTTLVAVEAEQEAMEEAEFNAKAAFALWMHERFTVKNVFDKKTIVVRKGQSETEQSEAKTSEQSETVTISKRHAEQMASAVWRGMSIFWHKRSKGRYISVWRWSVTEQKLAKLVEMLTHDSSPASLNREPDMEVKDIEGTFR